MSDARLTTDLDEAIREIDFIISAGPSEKHTVGSRLAKVRLLLMRVRNVADAHDLKNGRRLPQGSIAAVLPYLQSVNFGLDRGSELRVSHNVLPLPLNEERLSLPLLCSDGFRRSVQDAVLETVNDGKVDYGWMTEGGFDWESGDDWFEFRNALRRGAPLQAIRIYRSGLIVARDRTARGDSAYASTRFQHFCEATIAFADRALHLYPSSTAYVAVSSHLENARLVKLGVPGTFGPNSQYDMLEAKELADQIDVPTRPQLVERQQLRSEARSLALTQVRSLQTHYTNKRIVD
jgi:hypothetical protein